MIIFCPFCKKSTGSISDYGFGSIVPCDIYLGEKIIASIPSMNELISKEFGIKKLCVVSIRILRYILKQKKL